MKENELRIGNWVFDHTLNQYDQIEELRTEGAFFVKSNGYIKYQDLQPIPLTPEILEKSGFVTFEDGWYGYIPFGVGYVYTWNIYDTSIRWKGSCIEIENLHDLQNLHFALYKEELPINL